MNLTANLLELTSSGGEWVLWILIVLSFFSLAVIIERAVYISFRQNRDSGLTANLLLYLKDKKVNEAIEYITQKPTVQSQVLRVGLENIDKGSVYVGELMESQTLLERKRLSKRLVFLATVGSNAPFIGLFGTVLGIIKAFRDLSLNISGGVDAVMAGISEALVATAVGLFVAIPATLAYNYFQKQIRVIFWDTDSLTKTVLANLRQ